MRITTVIGTRPQFIKASYLSRRFVDFGIQERIVHTGQHYDKNMSDAFFKELDIPIPTVNFKIGSQSHGIQTGLMLEAIDQDIDNTNPDALLVYGDTNSTLAGALSASKKHIPVIHIEAGLRSFDRKMPEEINRVLTDHLSELLLCPTKNAVQNLKNEGIVNGVVFSGDVMYRVQQDLLPIAKEKSTALEQHQVRSGNYYLATVHRAENTNNSSRLIKLLNFFGQLNRQVILPMHPRTKMKLEQLGWDNSGSSLKIITPLGYLDMLALTESATLVLTDSGGLQKEAAWLGTQCITLRETTEWVETLESGWNILTGINIDKISLAIEFFESNKPLKKMEIKRPFSAKKVIKQILNLKSNSVT